MAAEIHGIGLRLEAYREGADRRAAHCFAAAAESCLPAIAQVGFAEEVAHACLTIAREGRGDTLVLSLSPLEVRAVAAALEARAPEIGFQLIADETLDPGRARIAWPEGGADVIADRLAAAALSLMNRRLGTHGALNAPTKPGAEAPPRPDQSGEEQ
ncbi:MAG: hypothetical protein AAFP17_18000 [Pseudomonadota bacterium]